MASVEQVPEADEAVSTPDSVADSPATSEGATGFRWGRVVAAIGVCTGLAVAGVFAVPLPSDEELLEGEGVEPVTAEAAAPPQPAMDPQIALALGETLQRQGQPKRAFAVYDQIPDDAGPAAFAARIAQHSLLMGHARLVESEAYLKRAEALRPDHDLVVAGWASLLSLSGRRWESMPYLRESVRRDLPAKLDSLVYLSNIHSMPAPKDEFVAAFQENGDPYGMLCTARVAVAFGLREKALKLLLASQEMKPEVVETSVQVAEELLDAGKVRLLASWQANMPEGSEGHPGIWMVRGRFAHENGQLDEALRCYWEALNLDPNHDRACYQISQILSGRGDIEAAKPFLERSGTLALLIGESTLLYDGAGGSDSLARCVEACLTLGRAAEAAGYFDILVEADPEHAKIPALRERVEAFGEEPPWLVEGADLSRTVAYGGLPLPDFGDTSIAAAEAAANAPRAAASEGAVPVRFEDEAEGLGVRFVYRNGDDPDFEGRRMYEYTGGGVGAVDFDRDLWPDLYFTQGADIPVMEFDEENVDRLFRNVRGERFADVTDQIGVRDGWFGQGVSAGDYDGDGFPDLLVGNLNGKRLLRNLGDGTFEDVTEGLDITHDFWTTSVMLADLNADGVADIYDTTFLQGERVFTVTCAGEDGIARSCAPRGFDAAPDFVYYGDGEGGFRQAPAPDGWEALNGDGLGVVAGDFEGDDNLEVFIANDGRANFYFRAVDSEEGPPTAWEEAGVFSGLGFDDYGSTQACMGIAAEDFNHDGLLDLYVTNFYQESNTLYVNQGGGTFLDESRSRGLRDPSFLELGFGTQAMDADLDGWADIAVVNGHVDNFEHRDIPYRMKPQLYRNLEGDRFEEVPQESLGPYFEKPQLGRAMARLDWNRDGLEDFAVSNLEDPASLVTNKTETPNDWIAVRLVGLSRSRDATGTKVWADAAKASYVRQLTAGDGYQSANEQKLVFGLGREAGPVRLKVRWPGGGEETFEGLAPNREYLLVESAGEARALGD